MTHYVLTGRRVNLTPFMLAHMNNVVVREAGPIYIVGMITSIALKLGFTDMLAPLVPFPTHFLDKDVCHALRMITYRTDGRYALTLKKNIVESIVLPCPNLMDVRLEKNWFFDICAPEPGVNINAQVHEGGETNAEFDDTEREVPISDTHSHIILLALLQVHPSDADHEEGMTHPILALHSITY